MKALTNNIDGAALLKRHESRMKDISQNPIRHPLLGQPQLNSMARAYLRDLRAAEMLAWQLSGGDYLISGANGRNHEVGTLELPHLPSWSAKSLLS